MMEIGPAFDDIVDHPIMGRKWHASPPSFQGLYEKIRMLLLRRRNRT
jgi:hypothetical protein